MASEIKPCPFCGGDVSATVRGGRAAWGIFESAGVEFECSECDAEFDLAVGTNAEEDNLPDKELIELILNRGIEQFNMRAERTCRCTTKATAWCFVCSECGKSFPRDQLKLAHNHGEINYCPNCGAKVMEAEK